MKKTQRSYWRFTDHQRMRVPAALHPRQQMELSVFIFLASNKCAVVFHEKK